MQARKILSITLGNASTGAETALRAAGWEVVMASGPTAVRQILRDSHFLVCLLTVNRSDPQVFADIEACIKASVASEWVGVFHPRAVESANVRDLILGYFFDYHTLPADVHYLTRTIGHAYGRAALRAARDTQLHSGENMNMVGHGTSMLELRRQIRKVAPSDAPVLICGESGSGKELAAQAIHRYSSRASGPFIAVNCGAISPSLIHSELFGHERGSFTGALTEKQGLIEAANGGTIFLDEIADLSLELQTNLLRFLQEKTINRVGATKSLRMNARVISATHMDLPEAVAAGRFREDLYYRLNVLSISVPALRERKEDIPMLARHFYEQCMAEKKKRMEGFSKQAIAALMAHEWPGNVRELYNRVQRAVVMTERRMITPQDLGLSLAESRTGAGLDSARITAERDAIRRSLNRVGRNITHAARDLGVSRMTLYRLMEKHGIGPNECRAGARPVGQAVPDS